MRETALPIDHSETYRLTKLKHLPHVLRLRAIRKVVGKYGVSGGSLADFGCSNGFITEQLKRDLQADPVGGFDHSENLEIAKANFPDIAFEYVDLNEPTHISPPVFDTVTCFETLEHVGKPEAAVQRLLKSRSPNGVVIMSVPIEIGFVGILKYLAKRFLYRYELELEISDKQYFISLLRGDRICRYRADADGFSTHFGFDYRIVDDFLRSAGCTNYLAWNSFTTRFYVVGAK